MCSIPKGTPPLCSKCCILHNFFHNKHFHGDSAWIQWKCFKGMVGHPALKDPLCTVDSRTIGNKINNSPNVNASKGTSETLAKGVFHHLYRWIQELQLTSWDIRLFVKSNTYPPGNDHISPPKGIFESMMIFRTSREWWNMWSFPGG